MGEGHTMLSVLTSLFVLLLERASGLVSCPGARNVLAQDGADGHFHILPGDFLLTNQTLQQPDGGANVTITFTLRSAWDNSSFACFGQLLSPGSRAPTGTVAGKCSPMANDTAIGDAPTTFTFGLEEQSHNNDFMFRIDQQLQCNSGESRPRRAHVTTDNFKVYPKCNSDRSSCTLAEDPNPWMYSDSLKSAAPLTDCAARSLPPAGNPTWNVYNITYFDMSHNVCLFCIPSPPGGAAFVDLYMSPIDFAMRCSPSGPDLRMSGGGSGSSTWYRCDTGGDLANPPDAPPTWILFDQMTWQVTLRQEWNCTAEDGQVTNFAAIGATTLPYVCDNDPKTAQSNFECWATAGGVIHPNVTAA